MKRFFGAVLGCATVLVLLSVSAACAQTDEIQVYTGEIVDVGKLGLTFHNNFTANGRKTADIPGGIVPHHALNGVPEFAYGVTDWFEAGLYLPVYSLTADGRFKLDSVKLRALFVQPHNDDKEFIYGVNFELSYNAKHWDQARISAEMRPIIGWHLGQVDIVFNPILDTGFDGLNRLDFAPGERIAYNIDKTWAVAVEHYADFGPLRQFYKHDQQDQSIFAVVDYGGAADIEFGVGHGFTKAGDSLVFKLMVGFGF